ncbi:MAG: nucleotide exchange factor GrpE [Desulfobacterales bacterium]|jgi:molecular chaperone GrpE|nr:nucleotide exchange factor GrpE [Desulfobacterales bacterium]
MSAKEKIRKYEEAEQAAIDQDLSHDKEKKGKKEIKEANADLQAQIQVLEDKLSAAEADAKSKYDQVLRVAAEFDNYKKRSIREIEDFRKYANEALFRDLIVVVDNLERAISSTDVNDGAGTCVLEGVKMTHQEILKIFEKFNVKPILSVNQPFDPVFHQAMFQEETNEVPENTVIKEMQRGYLIHDRLLRPAMVIVSKAAVSGNGSETTETGPDIET